LYKMEDQAQSQRIRELEGRVRDLELQVRELEGEGSATSKAASNGSVDVPRVRSSAEDLTPDEIERYSRQLITSNSFGVAGQRKLLASRVLVIGAGGIGSSLLLYLAAAGVGCLGIVDFDAVELSNLHRQVIHRSDRVGVNKALSARQTLHQLNPSIDYIVHECQIDHDNALNLVEQYDCVVDCSDNPKTRYTVNDACVLADKPLVSGSAVGLEGQITVYNYEKGPCYRCLYPRPSATAGCRACADAGVFGPVPGLIGIMQATETIKLLTRTGSVLSNRLVMYDSLQSTFLSVKKPPKRANCPACGTDPSICSMADSMESLLTAAGPQHDAFQFPPFLADELNVTCLEYGRIRREGKPHILLDVRVVQQYDLCHLPESVNVPLDLLTGELDRIEELSAGELPVFCVCRRGVASVEATRMLHEARLSRPRIHSIRNVAGGLSAWRETVDPSFPKY
jgi:adenylyltransferase/sulfurtransferase